MTRTITERRQSLKSIDKEKFEFKFLEVESTLEYINHVMCEWNLAYALQSIHKMIFVRLVEKVWATFSITHFQTESIIGIQLLFEYLYWNITNILPVNIYEFGLATNESLDRKVRVQILIVQTDKNNLYYIQYTTEQKNIVADGMTNSVLKFK